MEDVVVIVRCMEVIFRRREKNGRSAVKNYYDEQKKKNPKYTYKQAQKDYSAIWRETHPKPVHPKLVGTREEAGKALADNPKSNEWRKLVMEIYKPNKGNIVGHKDDKDKTPILYSLRDAIAEAQIEYQKKYPKHVPAKEKRKKAIEMGDYHPYGKKNKRPLTQKAAERILLQYY